MRSRLIVNEIRQAWSRIEKLRSEDGRRNTPPEMPPENSLLRQRTQTGNGLKDIQQVNRSLREEILKLEGKNEELKKECFDLHLKLEELLYRSQKK